MRTSAILITIISSLALSFAAAAPNRAAAAFEAD